MIVDLANIRERTSKLTTSPLFRPRELSGTPLSHEEEWRLTVRRTSALAKTISLSSDIIHHLTDEWWALQLDPIFTVDTGSCTLLSIQYNLVAGTLSRYVGQRPDLRTLLDRVLRFDVFGHFCLTEIEHGLDARNLETTATQLPSGGFDLHTPHHGAAKFMPPTAPSGLPGVGIIFARLVIDGKQCGVRGFIVDLTDGEKTYPGVKIRVIHGRVGCKSVKHSVTSFDHVTLPQSALLGPAETPTLRERDSFDVQIWRVAVGAISLAGFLISALKISCYIAGKYSQRRTVASYSTTKKNNPNARMPIIGFSTQYRPILMATANAFVIEAFYWRAAKFFSDPSHSYHERHAMGTVLKLLVQRLVQADMLSLSERCGAQGLFAHNQITSFLNEMRGVGIAEGDALVLSIRLVSELLLGKYTLPAPNDPTCILYRHEEGLFAEATESILTVKHHRSDAFNRLILPRCEKLALSIGHRMAYEAAVEAGLSTQITNLYRASAVQANEGWFAEKMEYSREAQFRDLDGAVQEALPHLDDWLKKLDVEEYVSAPIIHQGRWMRFFHNLEVAPSHGDIDVQGLDENLVDTPLENFGPLKARL